MLTFLIFHAIGAKPGIAEPRASYWPTPTRSWPPTPIPKQTWPTNSPKWPDEPRYPTPTPDTPDSSTSTTLIITCTICSVVVVIVLIIVIIVYKRMHQKKDENDAILRTESNLSESLIQTA